MKLPRVTLRDFFWLILVVGLILTVVIRERQTISRHLHEERLDHLDSGWRWSFQTVAEPLTAWTTNRSETWLAR